MAPSAVEAWGSTEAERAAAYPCDGIVERADHVLFRAIDVDAPTDAAFRWLCQLRAGPYSYDWIDNFGRRSPRRMTEGLEQLEVGQRILSIFRVVSFEPGQSITMDSTTWAFGRMAATYAVTPRDGARSRFVVKLVFRAPGGVYGRVARRLLPAADLVMMRKQLLNLKALAERDMMRA